MNLLYFLIGYFVLGLWIHQLGQRVTELERRLSGLDWRVREKLGG